MNKKTIIILSTLAILLCGGAILILSLNLHKANKTNDEMTQLFEIEKEEMENEGVGRALDLILAILDNAQSELLESTSLRNGNSNGVSVLSTCNGTADGVGILVLAGCQHDDSSCDKE